MWSALPVGENNQGPPDDPILDTQELEQWKQIQEIMSRFIFLYARASNPEMASIDTYEENSFPSSEWRMRFTLPSATAIGPDTVALEDPTKDTADFICEEPQLNNDRIKKLKELKEKSELPDVEILHPSDSRKFASSSGLGVSAQEEEDRVEEALKEQYLNELSAHEGPGSGNDVSPFLTESLNGITECL